MMHGLLLRFNLRFSELDCVISFSYPAEPFPYHGEQSRQTHETENSNDDGYDPEGTEFLALPALYSFDPYNIKDDRKADVPEYTSGQDKDNYSFQNHHFLLLLLIMVIFSFAVSVRWCFFLSNASPSVFSGEILHILSFTSNTSTVSSSFRWWISGS